MKKALFILILSLISLNSEAQLLTGGVKAGLNYNSNGDLIDDLSGIKVSSDAATGFHVGIFAELKLPLFLYLRPEFSYTHTNSSYELSSFNSDLSMDKLDAPVLVGIRFLKIGRVFLGPSFQYILDSDLSYSGAFDEIKEVNSNDFSVGAQFGFGVEIGKLGIDLRWERGISDTEIDYIAMIEEEVRALNLDARSEQFILSIYFKFK